MISVFSLKKRLVKKLIRVKKNYEIYVGCYNCTRGSYDEELGVIKKSQEIVKQLWSCDNKDSSL